MEKKVFTHDKTPKKAQKYKIVLKKKFLSNLVKQLMISWTCFDPSAHTDVFKTLLVPDWLCGGLIHLNINSFNKQHSCALHCKLLNCSVLNW